MSDIDPLAKTDTVLVLGMHRSGTSALTHVLELLGVSLSENLLPATVHNLTGHYEDQEVMLLNEKILQQFDMSWHSLATIQGINFKQLSSSPYSQKAIEIVNKNAIVERWGLKDPRICRLLPFWLDIFDQTKREVSAVLTVRHPADVAASLNKRDGTTVNHALALWLQHTLSAEKNSRDLPRCFVSFESLITEKLKTSQKLASFLNLDKTQFDSAFGEIDSYISERFINNDVEDKSGYARDYRDEELFDIAQKTYALIAAGDDTPEFRNQIDEVALQFEQCKSRIHDIVSESMLRQQYVEGVKDISQKTGLKLADAVKRMCDNDSRLSQKGEVHDLIFMGVIEDLVRQAISSTSYAERKYIDPQLRKEMEYFIKFFTLESGFSNALNEYKDQLKITLRHDDYHQWIAKHELREVDAEILAERMMLHWHQQPVMHCFMFVLPGEESLLADTIDSLSAQLLRSWQLTVVAASPMPDPIFEQVDFLHWRTLQEGESPYHALNEEIRREPTHWVCFAEPGMQFSVQSLAKIADYINLHPDVSFVYTDDDIIDAQGGRSLPRFKPDFNLDLLRSSPYIGNGWMVASHLVQLGGIKQIAGAENYDLALRWFEHFGESAFCHIPDVLVHKSSLVDRPFDSIAGKKVLMEHFERLELPVEIHDGYVDNSYRIEYHHNTEPKVSIIIPTKDKLEFLQPCLESLLDKTSYAHYEVLVVDNQSSDPDTLAYYAFLDETYSEKVRVLFFDKPFNFSEMNNWAAKQAEGEYLLMLNNDTEIIQPDWIERLLNHAQRDDVGVVGARLLYPESGRIQHAGVVLGMTQLADHPFNDMIGLKDASYMDRASLDQNYSAVTAAMLMVKHAIYDEVGGMDEVNLAVLFNDVDLCLRVGKRGYRIVWTPYAIGIHHGSASLKQSQMSGFYYDIRGFAEKTERTRREQRYMLNTWLPLLADDPAYNRNLSLRKVEFDIDLNAPQNWDIHHHLRTRVYGVPIRGGSGDYRVKQPFISLAQSGKALCEYGSSHLHLTELERLQPDTLVVQNAISDKELELLQLYQEFKPEPQIVFMLDDLLHDLPEKSSQYRKMKAAYRDAKTRLRKVLSYCDRLIVSTEPLAEMCQHMIDEIMIIPNRLQKDKWLGLTSLRQQSAKPRVGWAGAQQHQGDLELIIDVVKETAEEVDWVFFGMCPEEIRPYVAEEHTFVDIELYPEKLASLNLDLAVAPLEDHDFNRAKSNLRLLEYGVLGWPVVCSDIFPYQTNDAPVIRVKNEKAAWLAAIRQILADPTALQKAGDDLKAWVEEHYILEDHLDEWASALINTESQAISQNTEISGHQTL